MAEKNILIFGAGKIGRSFIGQLFGKAGYHIVFVDMDNFLVNELNNRRSYPVIIRDPDVEEKLVIENVSAIFALDEQAVIEEIVNADLVTISVGKNALHAIAIVVAKGLLAREQKSPGRVLDVILAENMRSADLFLREKLREILPPLYPLDAQVGLVETSIGKMVPIMTAADIEEDPLQVFAESYNTLILSKNGFRGQIPNIEEFALKENMKAWVDRKAFIHNLGHATSAYYGHLKYPDATFMYEVLADKDVFGFAKSVMLESARVLLVVYPGEFTDKSLSDHIDDLLFRFQNQNLGDTIFRVGSDLPRKLGPDDRFMGIIRLAIETNLPYGRILEAMSMGFLFQARNEKEEMLSGDIEFQEALSRNPDQVLQHVCGLESATDTALIVQLKQNLNCLKSAHSE